MLWDKDCLRGTEGTAGAVGGAAALLLPRLRREGVRGDMEGDDEVLEVDVAAGSTARVGPLRGPFWSDPRRVGFVRVEGLAVTLASD